ncbi:MAG: hypothetical protein KAT90_13335 [Gammaproteobacteria bacterium]|nr:hypothetical protein [Gammaproteobacteria bacterium]
MCKGEFWIPKDREVHILGATCSEACEEDYRDDKRTEDAMDAEELREEDEGCPENDNLQML